MKWRYVLLVSLVLALLVLPAFGAQPTRKAPKTEVSYPVAVASSPAFRDLPVDNREVTVGTGPNRTIPNPELNKTTEPWAPEAFGVDAALQYRHGNAPAPSPLISFDGINNISGYAPPDTQGDIGPNHYMQWVNVSLAAWSINRATWTPTLVLGPVAGNSIWSALGGQCASDNWGDPIVLWDSFRNRWVISQFALGSGAGGPYKTAIAVSKTADPTGAWWLYCYDFHLTTMNDYPKFGVWPDGYYYTCNQFTGGGTGWGGAGLMVFEADKMINGDPTARQLKIDLGAVSLNYGGMLPAHFEGTNNPPAGSGYFVEVDDSTWMSPPLAQDSISLWKAHVNWTTPSFTVGLAGLPDLTIPVTNFTPLCIGNRNCIPQPGTTQNLDAIGDRAMYRLQYRNFGSYEAMVFNLTVDGGSAVAGVRWFELRKDGGHPDWYLYQEGTYAPADGKYRWMGSAAQDHMGDLCLGYSLSDGTATYPSVAYAGRLAGDPAGTLPQAEVVLHAGAASQTGVNRWGDYSTLSIDPVDDCTFWYTQEYSTGGWNWATRIGAFKFGSCSVGPTGTLSGTVTDAGTLAPIAGATVSATNGTITANGTTGPAGTYSMTLPITPPAYSVTASAFGYGPANVAGIAITNGGTTTQNFALTGATSYTVSGTVTDANTGWGLYANVTITASGWAGTTIQTSPTTGAYSISLVGGVPYTFNVASIVPGYSPGAATVGPLAGPVTQNFPLAVNNCGAPGYTSANVTVLSEPFDSVTAPILPSGWTTAVVSGSGGAWATRTSTRYPSGQPPHSAPNLVFFNSWTAASGASARLAYGTPLDFTTGAYALSFWMYHDTGYGSSNDRVQVQVSTDGGTVWQNVGAAVPRYTGATDWARHTIALTGFTGPLGAVRVGLLGVSAWGNDCHVDDLSVVRLVCNTPPGGLIAGFVKDASTTAPIAGASVANATTTFTGSSNAQGFYAVYAAAGPNALTASKPTYQNANATPTGIAGATVQQDFNLITAAQYTLSGAVTDATTGWPLYATLVFSASGVPAQTIYTNPVTGAYSVTIYSGMVYNVAGTAWVAGYTPLATTVGPIAGNTTQNYTMPANLTACTAPGYTSVSVFQNFDGVTPPALPAGWSMARTGGSDASTAWVTKAGTNYPSGYPAYSAPNLVYFNSWSVSTGNSARLYYTTPLDLTVVAPTLSFYMFHDTGYSSSNDLVQVQVSTDGGTTWQNVGSPISRYLAASNAWSQHTVALAGFTGPNTAVLVGINALSDYGNDIHLDDIRIGNPGCSPPATGGLIVGNVYDANTNLALNGATVNDTTSGKSAMTAATVDPNLDDGFYCLYGNDGANAMNATATLYSPDNQTATVPHYGAVRRDFHLPVGRLNATPASLAISLVTGHTGQQTFDLSNIGGGSLNFTLQELTGHVASPQLDPLALNRRPEGWAKGRMLTAFKKSKTPDSIERRPMTSQTQPQMESFGAPEVVPPVAEVAGLTAYAVHLSTTSNLVTFNTSTPGTLTNIGPGFSGQYFGGAFAGGDFSKLYVIDYGLNTLGTLNTTTGAYTLTGPCATFGGESWTGLTISNTGAAYASSTNITRSTLYTVNLSTGAATVVGQITNAPGIIDIAVNLAGEIYGVDIVTDNLVKINPVTGAGTVVGALGVNANYAQGLCFDLASGVLYWASYSTTGELRTIDTTTGTSSLVGAFQGGAEVDAFAIATFVSPDVPWLDENPKTGLLAPGAHQTITVDYNAAGLTPGVYLATIRANNTTPYGPVNLPVTLTVLAPVTATAATGDPVSGMAPLTVHFTGSASGGNGVYTYDWNFGDGSPHSALQNPAHTYNTGGTFTVTLVATDGLGNTGTDAHLVISVTAPAAPVVLNFYDDAGRARLCLNRITGAYSWEIISGPGVGVYTGVAIIVNGGAKAYSTPSDPNRLNNTYDAIRKKASGYFYTPAGAYSRLTDSNTTNNPPGCY